MATVHPQSHGSRRRPAAAAVAALLVYSGLLAFVSLTPVPAGSGIGGTAARRFLNNALHVPAYAVLAWLWMRTLGALCPRLRRTTVMAAGAVAAAAFGAATEAGQALVPGRMPGWGDILLNTAGVALATLLVLTHPGWVFRATRGGEQAPGAAEREG